MSIKYKISIECPIERRHITNGEIIICQTGPAKVFCDVVENCLKSHSSFKEINEFINKCKRQIKNEKRS